LREPTLRILQPPTTTNDRCGARAQFLFPRKSNWATSRFSPWRATVCIFWGWAGLLAVTLKKLTPEIMRV